MTTGARTVDAAAYAAAESERRLREAEEAVARAQASGLASGLAQGAAAAAAAAAESRALTIEEARLEAAEARSKAAAAEALERTKLEAEMGRLSSSLESALATQQRQLREAKGQGEGTARGAVAAGGAAHHAPDAAQECQEVVRRRRSDGPGRQRPRRSTGRGEPLVIAALAIEALLPPSPPRLPFPSALLSRWAQSR